MTASASPRDACTACGNLNDVSARFCSACGGRLTPASEMDTVAERRNLTVLFVDIVGSTERAEALDPEDWLAIVKSCQQAAAEVIDRYEGHIAQLLGDGMLVYFGYPRAHEDDAARALMAGLEMRESILEAGGRVSPDEPLDVRIGIHTGPVVVGQMGGGGMSETLAMGHTTNVAARLQSFSDPGTVVTSEATRRLAAGRFVTRDLGTPRLKGLHEPIQVHLVLRPSGVRSRLDVAGELTPFVGRTEEIEGLLTRWRQVQAGSGQSVLVSGEPGVGKSRLLLALRQRFLDDSHTWLEARCSPYAAASAFAPIRELVLQGLGVGESDDAEERFDKLVRRLKSDGFPVEEALPVMAAFLDILPASYQPPALPADVLRERSMRFLVDWGLAMAAEQPVLMLVEDLHWCDPSSLEFLDLLVERAPEGRILVLLTTRPEFDSPWRESDGFSVLGLGGLMEEHTHSIVAHLCADLELPVGTSERIVARADGVPLHVEELTKMVLEAATGDSEGIPAEIAIPATLEDSLMARLDQLDEAKAVAQTAALLGREFDYQLLKTVSEMDAASLRRSLNRLVDAGLVFASSSAGRAQYVFKHALIQDAAYQSLLRSRRREIHGRAARALSELYPEVLARQPELIARHYTEAEDWLAAARHWLLAGQAAMRGSATREAMSYLDAGLACVPHLEEGPERLQVELEILVTLGPALMAARGYADPDVEAGYRRAREICGLLGNPPVVFPVMFGLWTYHCLRAKHVAGRELATDLTTMAEATGDSSLLLEADLAMGANLFYLGEYGESRRRLERGIAAYDAERDQSHRFLYGQDPYVGSHGYLPFVLWLTGKPGEALRASERGLIAAREFDHPFSMSYALTFAAWFQRMRGDLARCQALAEELVQLATVREVALYRAVGIILQGSVLATLGRTAEGLEIFEAGMDEYRATGSSVILPYWETLHADALRRAGRFDEAEAALNRSFDILSDTGECWSTPEAHRYRALLLDERGAERRDVRAELERSVSSALDRGAVAWALRSTLALHQYGDDEAASVRRIAELRRQIDESAGEPDLVAVDMLLNP